MLFDLELALVVKQTVQYKRSITVGALNRQAVEGRVAIGHESVRFQGEVAESGAVGLLENATRQREPLIIGLENSVTGTSWPRSSGCGSASTNQANRFLGSSAELPQRELVTYS